jgi:GNAT superfamily N-acetyltransferase
MDRYEEEALMIVDLYNEAWSHNWGHVPMTENEFTKIAKDMKQILDPALAVVVENSEGPIGFAISLPDINYVLRRVPDGRLLPTGFIRLLALSKFGGISAIRTLLMGVRTKYQGRGIDAVLVASSIENGQNHGFEAAELSWVLDSNHRMINHLEAIGAVRDKEYGMFEKQL